MPNLKHLTVDQVIDLFRDLATRADARFLGINDGANYTIKKQTVAETGYSATYQLFSIGTGSGGADEPVGVKVNIPLDMVVSSGLIVTITYDSAEGKLYDGAVDVTEIIKGSDTPSSADAGKYIKLIIANSTNDKIYIKVTDLVDLYVSGDGIEVDNNNAISISIDITQANGLIVGPDGLGLNLASSSGAGAMSSQDYTKLAGLSYATSADIQAIKATIWPSS